MLSDWGKVTDWPVTAGPESLQRHSCRKQSATHTQLGWEEMAWLLAWLWAPSKKLRTHACHLCECQPQLTLELGGAGPVLGIVEEAAGLLQHQLQLQQLAVAALEALAVGIHLQQLAFQLIQPGLETEE